MKIAIVASSFLSEPGTLERRAYELARGLSARGVEVEVLAPGMAQPPVDVSGRVTGGGSRLRSGGCACRCRRPVGAAAPDRWGIRPGRRAFSARVDRPGGRVHAASSAGVHSRSVDRCVPGMAPHGRDAGGYGPRGQDRVSLRSRAGSARRCRPGRSGPYARGPGWSGSRRPA